MWKPTEPPHVVFKRNTFAQAAEISSFIYQIGQTEMLRQPSMMVPKEEIGTEDFQAKINYTKSCLLKYRELTGKGRGLAAPQIGIPLRFAAIFMPEIPEQILIVINPAIIRQSNKLFRYPEICMSAQPAIAPVVRPAWIEFSYLNEQGEEQLWSKKAEDDAGKIYNRVFEHEIDHLDGVINIDRVKSSEIVFDWDPDFYNHTKFEEVI
ncbi:hypothetical protein HGB07_09350 [Candidatus Roizmanbacteria bacterium]|nr:hypothetical protein [Candidatus Roizmanbacteria bacterium]